MCRPARANKIKVLKGVKVEPGFRDAFSEETFQFLRQGYFCVDRDSSKESLVFNRTATLRDTWAKIEKAQGRK